MTKIDHGRTFKSIDAKRMFQCKGKEYRIVSAHMSVLGFPFHIFDQKLRRGIPFNRKFQREYKERLYNALDADMEEFECLVAHYKRTYDSSFSKKDLPILVLEGTGSLNAVCEDDPFLVERMTFAKECPIFQLTKREIYHPLGDPYQFYLNPLSIITQHFIKKHHIPLSTFVLSYWNKSCKGTPYGITFDDLIENDKSTIIIPRECMTDDEVTIMYKTCRLNVHAPTVLVIKGMSFQGIEKSVIKHIGTKTTQSTMVKDEEEDEEEEVDIFDTSLTKIIGGKSKKEYDMFFSNTIKIASIMSSTIQKRLGERKLRIGDNENKVFSNDELATLLYTCKPKTLFYKEFVDGVVKECTKARNVQVLWVDCFMESLGNLMNNVVFVIVVRKKKIK
ncbi:MAG: hypothetical protein ACTSUE_16670 [Promethearchaeota archaeon]